MEAKIYIENACSRQMFAMPNLEAAAMASLYSNGPIEIAIDLREGSAPTVLTDSVFYRYIPTPTPSIGGISFSAGSGWRFSVYANGLDKQPTAGGHFNGHDDLVDAMDNNDRKNLWVKIWPVYGFSLPLGF